MDWIRTLDLPSIDLPGMDLPGMIAWLYALFMIAWFGLTRLRGDSFWWLALLNSFAPWLFLPTLFSLLLAMAAPSWSHWLSILPPACLFLALYGHHFAPKRTARAAATEHSITLMTFNLLFLSRLPATARAIEENGLPDIVALQELEAPMAQIMDDAYRQQLPYRWLVPAPDGPRLGLLSRFPLTPLAADHLNDCDFRVQLARVAAPGGSFLLYNIHPRATNIMRYRREGQSIAHETASSFAERLTGIERLLTDIANRSEPVIVMGDFNSTPQHDVYRALAAQLTDAHAAAGWGLGHTFPAHRSDLSRLPIPKRLMRLDMIFFSAQFSARHCRVGRFHGESDHYPVIATLAWKEKIDL